MIHIRPSGLALALALAAAAAAVAPAASAQDYADVRIAFAPPPLPLYDQPELPGPDYVWAPGYWAWDQDYGDYYWVPGAWVLAPEPGYLWTPAWWGWDGGYYAFHPGYWGPHVGFYGGVAYGYGYTGSGYEGGYWTGGHFVYNSAVTRIGPRAGVAVYQSPVVSVNVNNRVSFNGGPGGVQAAPSRQELAATQERHFSPTAAQVRQISVAHATPQLFASANRGAPPIAATPLAGSFSGPGVVRARGAPSAPPPQPGVRSSSYGGGAPYAAPFREPGSPQGRGGGSAPVYPGSFAPPAAARSAPPEPRFSAPQPQEPGFPQGRGGGSAPVYPGSFAPPAAARAAPPQPRFPAPQPPAQFAAPGRQRLQEGARPQAAPARQAPPRAEPRRGDEEHRRPD